MNRVSSFIDRLISILQGRTTTFLVAFFLSGNVLHCVHRLDSTYITFMGVLMGYVLGHSIKEDVLPPPPPPPPAPPV